ncbi:hypothetical protein EVAR_51189_1 [Eumeta japonica]|uniref:Uncharacterized protein n=1 Tax=Eumeta variegata TaxID=151549 RepID=A0A4C1XB53_EUMVA|nr:hypothetical protein EVAR_51189_1 [Eumeta japonica]
MRDTGGTRLFLSPPEKLTNHSTAGSVTLSRNNVSGELSIAFEWLRETLLVPGHQRPTVARNPDQVVSSSIGMPSGSWSSFDNLSFSAVIRSTSDVAFNETFRRRSDGRVQRSTAAATSLMAPAGVSASRRPKRLMARRRRGLKLQRTSGSPPFRDAYRPMFNYATWRRCCFKANL